MISDDDYLDLPEDPELAFLHLERAFREKLQERIDKGNNNTSPYQDYYTDYVTDTCAAAEALDVGPKEWKNIELDRDNYYADYRDFAASAQKFTLTLRIKHSRRAKKYSVPLDANTRSDIHDYLTKLLELANKLEIPIWKRESILNKISDLATEIERPRARFDVVASFLLEAASVAGQMGEKLEPWRKWVDSISRLLGAAKEDEAKTLPAPEKPRELPAPDKLAELDDEIPF